MPQIEFDYPARTLKEKRTVALHNGDLAVAHTDSNVIEIWCFRDSKKTVVGRIATKAIIQALTFEYPYLIVGHKDDIELWHVNTLQLTETIDTTVVSQKEFFGDLAFKEFSNDFLTLLHPGHLLSRCKFGLFVVDLLTKEYLICVSAQACRSIKNFLWFKNVDYRIIRFDAHNDSYFDLCIVDSQNHILDRFGQSEQGFWEIDNLLFVNNKMVSQSFGELAFLKVGTPFFGTSIEKEKPLILKTHKHCIYLIFPDEQHFFSSSFEGFGLWSGKTKNLISENPFKNDVQYPMFCKLLSDGRVFVYSGRYQESSVVEVFRYDCIDEYYHKAATILSKEIEKLKSKLQENLPEKMKPIPEITSIIQEYLLPSNMGLFKSSVIKEMVDKDEACQKKLDKDSKEGGKRNFLFHPPIIPFMPQVCLEIVNKTKKITI